VLRYCVLPSHLKHKSFNIGARVRLLAQKFQKFVLIIRQSIQRKEAKRPGDSNFIGANANTRWAFWFIGYQGLLGLSGTDLADPLMPGGNPSAGITSLSDFIRALG
jgi:hypothetical protein